MHCRVVSWRFLFNISWLHFLWQNHSKATVVVLNAGWPLISHNVIPPQWPIEHCPKPCPSPGYIRSAAYQSDKVIPHVSKPVRLVLLCRIYLWNRSLLWCTDKSDMDKSAHAHILLLWILTLNMTECILLLYPRIEIDKLASPPKGVHSNHVLCPVKNIISDESFNEYFTTCPSYTNHKKQEPKCYQW